MKKKISILLSIALSMASMPALAVSDYTYSDWAEEELQQAEEAGIIPEEFEKRDFTKEISRVDFANVLVKTYEALIFDEVTAAEENPFTDTEDINALKAYSEGFIQGMGDGAFMPEELLSREQAAIMLTRVYKKVLYPEWSIEKDEEITLEFSNEDTFADDDEISDWAREGVYFMNDNNIVKGIEDNKFAPKNNISVEQAVIIAARFKNYIEKETEYDPDPYKDLDRGENPEKGNGENDYTIAFIGGSLTAGGAQWINATKNYLQDKMPDKNVRTLNAGKGGTTSVYGAARFSEDISPYAPDLVFIEFAVNDSGFANEDDSRVYMESMIRQCKKLSKEPVVIFLYAPYPTTTDTDTYKNWEKGVKIKEGLAKHYGIKSINVYDYMQRDYEKLKAEKNYKEYADYLKTMYTRSGAGFDVHGGYEKYAEAIIEAFDNDYSGCLSPMKNVGIYCSGNKKMVEAEYKQIGITSPRMNFSGKWEKYNAASKFATSDSKISIGEGHYSYPYFTSGIAQVLNDTAAFGFDTTAEAVSVNYTAATAGSGAKIYIDGKESGTITCKSIYHGVNYNTNWIKLPNDGKTHRVIFVVDRPSSDSYVFRFGSVIERYM